ADLAAHDFSEKTLWLPNPTWPNHDDLFSGAGVPVAYYPYLDQQDQMDYPAMAAALRDMPTGDMVRLHACCHNPTGYDLSREQWQEILTIIRERNLLPIVDFAYQGFAHGLDEDAYGVRLLAENLDEILITVSNCKNFGIYVERTGCLLV